MAYDTYLEERIERILSSNKTAYEIKKMMGGLCYMVDDKMCFGIVKDQLMARIGPEAYHNALLEDGVNEMNFTGRSMKGFVFIDPSAIDHDEQLEKWILMCLDYNPKAQRSKRKASNKDLRNQ